MSRRISRWVRGDHSALGKINRRAKHSLRISQFTPLSPPILVNFRGNHAQLPPDRRESARKRAEVGNVVIIHWLPGEERKDEITAKPMLQFLSKIAETQGTQRGRRPTPSQDGGKAGHIISIITDTSMPTSDTILDEGKKIPFSYTGPGRTIRFMVLRAY